MPRLFPILLCVLAGAAVPAMQAAADPAPIVLAAVVPTAPVAAPIGPRAAVPPVHAASNARCPAAGTRISTSIGGLLQFRDGDGLTCPYVNGRGQTFARWGVFWTPSAGVVRLHGDELQRLWPLEVGKEVSFVWTEGSESWRFSHKVARRETVTIPAGTFDTFVIEISETGLNGNSHRSVNRSWYAPKVGYAVKYEYELESGNNADPPRNWVATEVLVPGN